MTTLNTKKIDFSPFNPCPSLGVDEWELDDIEHAMTYFMYKYEPKSKYASYIHLDGRFYETYLKAMDKYGKICSKKSNPFS